ncbi:MAG: VCBS repeat-containing protein [Verrucomicrobia bacterium]|nr:VCBS repeat-containing protein [Verrucomicrobiota bacterium]
MALNVAPTIKPVENLKLTLGAPVPAVRLSGISAGAVNEKQEILISAVSDNPGLIPNPEVRYSTPGGDGVLVLIPAANQVGEATISVTVKDNGGVYGGGKDTTVVQFKVTIVPGGQQKVYFQNDDGTLALWEMNGTNLVRAAYLDPANPGEAGWTVQAVADFDRDGKSDLVLQHQDGRVAAWFMAGAKLKAGTMLTPTTTGDRNWRVVGAADMDGDTQVDLVFQNAANGMLAAWLMDGMTLRQPVLLNPATPGESGWRVVGTGDFDIDGKADLVFQNSDGTIAFWLMDGTNLVAGRVLDAVQSLEPSWRVEGTVDLNKDGQLDLLVQSTDGSLAALYLNGTLLLEQVSFDPPGTAPEWQIVGA